MNMYSTKFKMLPSTGVLLSRLSIIGLCMLLVSFPEHAIAGTIRHDVSDSSYTVLATAYDSVGKLNIGAGMASGVLIHENWVLTAAIPLSSAPLGTTVEFIIGGLSYSMDSLFTPVYGDGFDLALLKLATPATGVNPALLYTGAGELGSLGTAVGYGFTGTGLTGATNHTTVKRAGTNMIDEIDGSGIMWADFDRPSFPGESSLGSATPTSLEYLFANGDIGGGLFIEEGGKTYLAGIHSVIDYHDGFNDSDYGDKMGSTKVSLYVEDFINPFIDDPSSSSVPEPTTMLLLGTGLLGLAGARRRFKR